MIEILREPRLANQVNDSISKRRSKEANTYGVTEIANLPVIQSLLYETSRLRMAQYMIYPTKAHDILLDREYILPKGNAPIAFSQDVALDEKSWAKARPRTVDTPLDKFWAQRFLVPDRPSKRGSVESGEFSLEGLELLTPAFGGHRTLGLGREYADIIQAATFAVLLNEWEIQLCDPEETDTFMPSVREKAFGAVRPMDRIAVRIRKRKSNRGR